MNEFNTCKFCKNFQKTKHKSTEEGYFGHYYEDEKDIVGKCNKINSEITKEYFIKNKCPFNEGINNPLRIWCKVWS